MDSPSANDRDLSRPGRRFWRVDIGFYRYAPDLAICLKQWVCEARFRRDPTLSVR
jgi:hypothetical protein